MARDDFIRELTSDLPAPPQYFFHDAVQNKAIIEGADEILKHSLIYKPLPTMAELERDGVVLLDTRTSDDFGKGYIKGAISLPLTMNFSPWVGTLFPPATKFFVATEKGKETEAVLRLARIGYDKIVGVLEGGLEAYLKSGKPLEKIQHIAAARVTSDMEIYDVRNPPELHSGHIENVHNVPLVEIHRLSREKKLEEKIPKDRTIYVHCAGGVRSLIAFSILRNNDYHNVVNIEGGWDDIKKFNTNLKLLP